MILIAIMNWNILEHYDQKEGKVTLFRRKSIWSPTMLLECEIDYKITFSPRSTTCQKKNATHKAPKTKKHHCKLELTTVVSYMWLYPQLTKALDKIKGVLLLDLHITICTLKGFVSIFPSLAKSATNIR